MDVIHNMTIGCQKVFPAIQVVVKKETAEAQPKKAVLANSGGLSLVHKIFTSGVVVEAQHFRRKISDYQTLVTGMIIIGEIHPHPGPGLPVTIQRHGGVQSHITKCSIPVVTE